MLEIHRIRDEKDNLIEKFKIRNFDAKGLLNNVVELDELRRKSQFQLDQELSEMNQMSKKIGDLFMIV